MIRPLPRLIAEQGAASDPRGQVWLSASAGTGKTQVLVARVLRLLLRPHADPAAILCLTFTKAGAAEMANRLSERLAHWVRLSEAELRKELFNLGEQHLDAALIARARSLFARVLDARGGGLRIQTIHAFAQSLLGSFPLEAGLAPGFRPLEGREEAALARQVLAGLVAAADARGDALIGALQALSERLGEDGAEAFLRDAARAPEALAQLPADIGAFMRAAFDLPAGDVEAWLAAQLGDDAFDMNALAQLAALNRDWGTTTGLKRADIIAAWRARDPAGRAATLAELHSVWATAKGELQSFAPGRAPKAQIDSYRPLATRLFERVAAMIAAVGAARLADGFAAALTAGRAYAEAWAQAKAAAGRVDFDDLIRATLRLLDQPGIAEWIGYKLDQTTDHVLVDEAQDTNARQWDIVRALTAEFFAGEGARGGAVRTIFSVGDHKQAIFGFQGTDPRFFAAARDEFARLAEAAGQAFADLSLSRSFRTAPAVLELVDATIDSLPDGALGDGVALAPHVSARPGPGLVTLLPPVRLGGDGEDGSGDDDPGPEDEAGDGEDDGDSSDAGEEGWVSRPERIWAGALARRLRQWLGIGPDARPLMIGGGSHGAVRPLSPGDVMILVRKRGSLAALIVARLYAEGVPVAGVDRLRLNAPLAVRDLLAAARFALQPDDDLNLAALLVSPLIGWSQERLLDIAAPRRGRLWAAVRAGGGGTLDALTAIQNAADFVTPYRFFEGLLSGPLRGRHRLLARLGEEARDPIEELLSAALAFEGQANPSLQRFLDWFDRGDVEIVRDPAHQPAAVRVMTAHASKGLQAPMVILADATTNPDGNRRTRIDWHAPGLDAPLPLFRPRKAEVPPALAADIDEAERRDRAEHWRLLYVAMTRAEQRLVVGGALGPRARGRVPADSWYAAVERAMDALQAPADDEAGGARRDWAGQQPEPFGDAPGAGRAASAIVAAAPDPLPDWLLRPAPEEAQPPRPLAPSALGEDDAADPPPGPALRAAAERGRLLHALFERLPAVAEAERRIVAERWLAGAGGVADAALRALLVDQACGVIADPRFARVFAPDALAEAPIAAVVAGRVVAGTVDRLCVADDRVLVVDFKTSRRAPLTLADAPEAHLRQMAAYAAALAEIFPGRRIEAGLLYTAAPVLLTLDPATLDRFKPVFQP